MSETEMLPPHDIGAEQCALGAAMLSADAAVTVLETLSPEDFLRTGHQIVFRAIRALSDRGEPIDPVTVRLQMLKQRAGGEVPPDGDYLFRLVHTVPTAANVSYYTTALRRVSILRRLTEVGPNITSLGYRTAPDDAEHAIDTAQKIFDEATQVANASKGKRLSDLIIPFMDSLESKESRRAVATGLADLDRILNGGLRPGQLITIGARPSVGKSVALAGFVHHVGVKLGLPVFASTLEMSSNEYIARLVALDGSVDLSHILQPTTLTNEDLRRITRSNEKMIDTSHVVINDDPTLGIAGIRSELRDMRRAGLPAALVVVDYLQLMEMPGKVENRQVEVSRISRGLKLLAKEFEVPIAIGAQLNRNIEHRQEKRPMMSDLRESGSTENDSDVVILLNRPEMYEPETPRAGEIDLLIEKNRNGPRGIVTAAFQGQYSRIADLAQEPLPTRGLAEWQTR